MSSQASAQREVRFVANPTQRKFIESRAEADLFDSRKGEGKSCALVWAIFYHTRHNPGATWLVIRDTWENLRRTTLQEFFAWFPDGVFGTWHAQNKEFIWSKASGLSGRVIFIGAEDEADASKIASMPLAGVAIDEPSPAAGSSGGVGEFVFDTALAQLRQPGMKWYAAKLAQNNPDESHWTYRRFWDPGMPGDPKRKLLPLQERGFKAWQTKEPENLGNLPPDYYEGMKERWAHRPDLLKRFVEGKHGFQQIGRAITPEWSDELHLGENLQPIVGEQLYLFWDGGLNPTCVIAQVSPMGKLLVLESHVGDGIGMYELITTVVKSRLTTRFKGFAFRHIGDPNLVAREQSSSRQSAALVITTELGGMYIQGPVDENARIEPLRAVLKRNDLVVDKHRAKEVWYALRGGWHRHITRTGTVGGVEKNEHSHPGDATGYGTAVLFPLGRLKKSRAHGKATKHASYFGSAPGTSLGMGQPGAKVPKDAQKLGE
jgi:hypothetical protein